MKILFTILTVFCLSGLTMAQERDQVQENLDRKTGKKYQKNERRELQKMEEERRLQEIKELVESRRFVLEANFLSGRNGVLVPVVSNLNFIMIDSTNSVIQIGSPSGMGYNGVGGITDEGKVKKYEISEKKGGYAIKVYTNSSLNSFTIFFNISSLGNITARLSGIRGGVLTYRGEIVSIEESFVYKGQRTF